MTADQTTPETPAEAPDPAAEAAAVKAARKGSRAKAAEPQGAAAAEAVTPPPNPQAITVPTAPQRAPGTGLLEEGSVTATVAEVSPNSNVTAGGKWVIAPCDAQEQLLPARSLFPVCRKLWSKGQTVLRSRYEAWLALQPDAEGNVTGPVVDPTMHDVGTGFASNVANTVTVSPQAGL